MSICPHCGKTANPLRLSLYTTIVPYTCTSCRKRSRFDRRTMRAIGSVGILSGVLINRNLHLGDAAFVAIAAGGTVLAMAAMYFLLKLRPAEE